MLGSGQAGETKCLAQRYFVLDAEPVENLVSTLQTQQESSGQEARQTHYLTGLCPKRVAVWFLPAPSLECMQPRHTSLRMSWVLLALSLEAQHSGQVTSRAPHGAASEGSTPGELPA